MKTTFLLILFMMLVGLPLVSGQSISPANAKPAPAGNPEACANCAAPSLSTQEVTVRSIPGTTETMVVGRIENLVPIGILTVLGCEKCSAEAVNWAIQQGSSFDDIERTLRTVAAMQKLDCFKSQFGADVNARMEKPLAAATEALAQARTRAAK